MLQAKWYRWSIFEPNFCSQLASTSKSHMAPPSGLLDWQGMTAIGRFLLVWAVFAAALPAQDEVPVFSSTTRLVQFSLIALDRNGKALTDLKIDEVELFEKGKRRSLAFVRFDGAPQSKHRTTAG